MIARGVLARGAARAAAAGAAALIAATSTIGQETFDEDAFSIFDLVTDCDLLAAHPDDPDRMAEGVADDEIVPRLAIIACEDAAAEEPEEARFRFQLGRALLAVKRETEALAHFETAAETGYAAAHAYIGDIYQFGLGAPADPAKALEHYQVALAGKFEPAEHQIEQLQFEARMYLSRSISQLYGGDYAAAKSGSDIFQRNYLFNFVVSLTDDCDPFLTPSNLVNFYLYRYPPGEFSMEQEEDINVAIQTELGEHDAGLFLDRHGCEGPVAKQMFANLNTFFEAY